MAAQATHARLSVARRAGCSEGCDWFRGRRAARVLAYSAGAQKEVCAQGVAESKTLPSTPVGRQT